MSDNRYHEPIEDRLFSNERIWPCHQGGHWWRVEVLELRPGPEFGFDETAMNQAPFKWIARRRIRRARRRLTQLARERSTEAGGKDQ